ncbi:MAG: C25 family cysteine peptidase [Chitinivibrionales bacterium]
MTGLLCIFLLTIICRIDAATYTVDRVTGSSINVTYELNDFERRQAGPITLYFALTLTENTSCHGYVMHENMSRGDLQVLSRGWFGDRYLQWLSFTTGSEGSYPSATGSITIQTDRTVFSPTGRSIKDTNGILSLPLQPGLKKISTDEITPPAFHTGLRMSIEQEGIYHLTGEQLQEAGVPLSRIAPHSLRLFNRGKELPLRVQAQSSHDFESSDFISFYAHPLKGKNLHLNQYARAEVYWLVWELPGVALRVAEVSGARKRDNLFVIDTTDDKTLMNAREFPDTLHFEEDSDIRWLGSIYDVEQMSHNPQQYDTVDNWYWGFIGNRELTEYAIDVPGPSRNQNFTARLRVSFMGLSSNNSVSDDHRVEILLNDDQPGSSPQIASWDGQNSFIFESEPFPIQQLRNGRNRIIFRTPDRSFIDRSALNWIELEYMRNHEALDNTLFFRSSPQDTNGLFQFTLSGFDSPDISVWDITHGRFFTQLENRRNERTEKYDVVFQDSIIRPTRFVAVSHGKRLIPAGMVLDTIESDWNFHDVEYLMVTVDSLIPALAPLAELHEQRGLRTEIIAVEDIYNRFSHGIQDPAGIQKLIRHIFATQPRSTLKYLLLAGDATHDHYKKRENLTLVPTHLSRVPGWGPAADDGYFVTARGGDNFPDLAVGRFPARNVEDLQIMVEKTINYIRYPQRGYWRDNLLLAGGYEPDFTEFNDMVHSNVINQRFNIVRMDADPQSPYYRSQEIAASKMAGYINSGINFLNFAGHGGGNIWSDSRFFSYEDLPRLHNSQWGRGGRLPVIFSFTCLTGFFESVFYKSLGEEFVRNSYDGAIAFYGASAYTLKDIDLRFNRILLENLVHGSFKTLGDLIRHSELLALVMYQFQALPVIRQYNLLGEPALPIQVIEDTLNLSVDHDLLEHGDTLRISGSTLPVDSGMARICISAQGNIWEDKLISVENGRLRYSFPVKESATISDATIRVYAWNDSIEVVGWTQFSKDTIAIHETRISPSFPSLGDTVSVSCKIAAPDSLTEPQVVCLYTLDSRNSQEPDFDLYAPVRMERDSSDQWHNAAPIILENPPDALQPRMALYVKFRILGAAGETEVIPFPLRSQPDLTFTLMSGTKLIWENDSLRVRYEVLNQGNATAPPFELSVFRSDSIRHSIAHMQTADSLAPGSTVQLTVPIPDTTGIFTFSAHLNETAEFSESNHANNTISFTDTIILADVRLPSDTLFSPGRGYAIVGRDTLSQSYRLFLLSHSLPATPLSTPSQWLHIGEDGKRALRICSRPSLAPSDSLSWHVRAAVTGDSQQSTDDRIASGVLFYLDTLSHTWSGKYRLDISDDWMRSAPTHLTGPFAYGSTNDSTPPQIQALIGGREMETVDYTPRNKPFTFIINDPSGIDKQSIILLQNKDTLETDYWNLAADENNQTSITITAIPPVIQTIDSLTVIARDLAGNRAEQTFAYLPGEKLNIKFFSCHPNPFTGKKGKKVRFAFVLTDIAEDVSLSIFTIASKKIASFDLDPHRIGYQEIAWSGLTDNGYRIANGTYYAKLTARSGKRTVKKIIRIVKLEGF